MDGRPRSAAVACVLLAVAVALVVAGTLSRGPADERPSAAPSNTPLPTPAPATSSALQPPPVIGRLLAPTPTPPPARTQPLLRGESTGLTLFYGGVDPLQRVDLDTGTYSVFGHRARPRVATGGELVLETAEGRIGWVGVHDPGEMAEGWISGEVGPVPTIGELWISDADDRIWKRHQLAPPGLLERRPFPADGRSPTPWLLELGGNVYAWSDGWQLENPGQLVQGADGTISVLQCAESVKDCHVIARRGERQVAQEPIAESGTASPDGRFTASLQTEQPGVIIVDRVTGRSTMWRFPVMAEGGSLLFVESAGASSGS